MKGEHNCENCRFNVRFITKVDFGYGGIADEDCMKIDDFTDEDCERLEKGDCPHWQLAKEE